MEGQTAVGGGDVAWHPVGKGRRGGYVAVSTVMRMCMCSGSISNMQEGNMWEKATCGTRQHLRYSQGIAQEALHGETNRRQADGKGGNRMRGSARAEQAMSQGAAAVE